MRYDFTSRLERRGVGSFKWDLMLKDNPDLPQDVVPLSVADMEFKVAPPILDALRDYVSDGVMGYTGPTDEFYDACLGWQRRRHGWDPEREWVVLSPGVVPAFYNAVNAFTDPGDGVIVQSPVYYPFFLSIERNGRVVADNQLVLRDGRYQMDFDGLERLASDPRNKLMLLCSPHNPVGRVWTPEELRQVLDICIRHDVMLVSDEIHNDLIMPGHEHTTLLKVATEAEHDHVVVCTAPSKTFSLAGCQCSLIYVPDEDRRKEFVDQFDKGAIGGMLNTFAYPAATAAYNLCEDWLDELIQVVWANAQLVTRRLEAELPGVRVLPLEGTYLLWADFRAWGLTPDELEELMTKEALLYLDEGKLFGATGEGFERFNLACPTHVLDAAIDRLVAAARARGLA